ncbi:MAG: glycosyltransferase family 4 protein [Ignavibacteria bacterium]|nr:glycosyltransferase family 4 protein [Ignavibacteria bacterium]
MRILIVSSAYWPYPSGVSEHVYHLAEGLKDRGHHITLLTTNYPKIGEHGHFDDLEIIRIGRAYMLHINKSVSTVPLGSDVPYKVRKILDKGKFDIIHMHGCYPPEIAFWALAFSKTINCVTYHTVGFRRNIIYNISAVLFQRFAKKIHGHIPVSKIARQWSEPYMPGDYRVIPNGVDIERFSLRIQPFDKPKDSFIILYVGRFDKRKGIFIAIEAFSKIMNRFPNALLYVVGKGPLEKEARAYAQNLGLGSRCQFFGYVTREDLPRFYRTGDIYVSPALGGEAQGIVLLEAMACGKTVVASDIGGYQEVIEDGKNGILFEQGSAEDLALKIGRVIFDESLRHTLEINARARAEEYAWDKIVKQVEDYYTYLINKK